MDCCTPDFPVLHYLPEFAQIHVHWASDAIQLSHLLLPPSPPALNLSNIRVFSSESVLHIRWPKVLKLQLQYQSFQWIFRTDFHYDRLVWSACSPSDSRESSLTPQFKSINSSVLSFLYSPTGRAWVISKGEESLKLWCGQRLWAG